MLFRIEEKNLKTPVEKYFIVYFRSLTVNYFTRVLQFVCAEPRPVDSYSAHRDRAGGVQSSIRYLRPVWNW